MLDWLKFRSQKIEGADSKALSQRLEDYVKEVCSATTSYHPENKVNESVQGKALMDSPEEQQIILLHLAFESYIKRHKRTSTGFGRSYTSVDFCETGALQQLMIQLMRRNLPYTEQDLLALLQLANDNWNHFGWYRPHNALVGLLERTYKDQSLPADLVKEVKRTIKAATSARYESAEERKLVERAKRLIGEGTKAGFTADFQWSKTILNELDTYDDALKHAWQEMLAHAQTAEASKPAKKWLATAEALMEPIGEQTYATTLNRWLTHIKQEKIEDLPLNNDVNATVVRGLIWAANLLPAETVAREIKFLAAYCFRKVKDVGAVSPKVGNACLHVLGQFPGLISVSMLSELLQKIKYPSARKLVEKALDAAAQRNHMTREDLMEISVPDFGLDPRGELHQSLGEATAVVSIEAEQKVQLLWQKSDGKFQKSIPTSVSEQYADEIKALKKQIKDMRTTLQSQMARIEKLFLRPQSWTYAQWCERYWDHPLLLHISHKLIWQFENESQKRSAMVFNGQLQDHHGQAVDVDMESAQVRLWHPVHAEVGEVLAWRNRISELAITQPFKQAHREVYLLTDAERTTEHYSNRFAAHILKQHQLNALCQQRGWRYSLQGAFDSWNAPTLTLPQWDLSVELYLETVENSQNAMGIFNYVSSDQVRFLRNNELLRLEAVEPIVFSEVMRDVDLFIGVCSIGNDPGWQDGGIHPGFNDYWRDYAFGDLLESANIRKEVLTNLLPKLKIAKQCEISGRFLIVKGTYRTYKIHLGSGNILMEPNDQYLCIVEGRGDNSADSRRLVLPFEGDHRLSVILSKAFLLANDTKITDKTILSQINR